MDTLSMLTVMLLPAALKALPSAVLTSREIESIWRLEGTSLAIEGFGNRGLNVVGGICAKRAHLNINLYPFSWHPDLTSQYWS